MSIISVYRKEQCSLSLSSKYYMIGWGTFMDHATLYFKEPFSPQLPVHIHWLTDSQRVSNGKNNALLSVYSVTSFTWVGTPAITDSVRMYP